MKIQTHREKEQQQNNGNSATATASTHNHITIRIWPRHIKQFYNDNEVDRLTVCNNNVCVCVYCEMQRQLGCVQHKRTFFTISSL